MKVIFISLTLSETNLNRQRKKLLRTLRPSGNASSPTASRFGNRQSMLPREGQRRSLPGQFSDMRGVPSNQFSWVHDSSVPLEQRVTPTRPTRSQSEETPPHNNLPTIERFSTPQGVLVSTDRTDDELVPVVQGSLIESPALPPLNTDSPSQAMASMLNDTRLEPSIWLSLASSVEERPQVKGWYIADSDQVDFDSEYTVKWTRLSSQDLIEDAFLSPTSKSVMVFGQAEQDDMKIDFSRFYAKSRNGTFRRPVLRVANAAEPGYPRLASGGVWEFNYENSDNSVSDWSKFDRSDCELFDLCAQAGRASCVIYDGNSAIAVNIFNGTDGQDDMSWSNVLWNAGCGGIEKSKGYIRRREMGDDEEGDDQRKMPGTSAILAQVARPTNNTNTTQLIAEARTIGANNNETETDMSGMVLRLKEMGFDEALAVQSLFDNRGDLDRALESLLAKT